MVTKTTLLSTCMKTCALLLIGAFAHTKTETAEQHFLHNYSYVGSSHMCSISTNEKMACSHVFSFILSSCRLSPYYLPHCLCLDMPPPPSSKKKKKEQWQVAYLFQLVTNFVCTKFRGFVCIYLHCYLILDLGK